MQPATPSPIRLFTFVAGAAGRWRVDRVHCLEGAPLAAAPRLEVHTAPLVHLAPSAAWVLRGITSNERYVERGERSKLGAVQQGLGRVEATRAALIPIRKNAAW